MGYTRNKKNDDKSSPEAEIAIVKQQEEEMMHEVLGITSFPTDVSSRSHNMSVLSLRSAYSSRNILDHGVNSSNAEEKYKKAHYKNRKLAKVHEDDRRSKRSSRRTNTNLSSQK